MAGGHLDEVHAGRGTGAFAHGGNGGVGGRSAVDEAALQGGHALADVLLGHANPSGKLPCTFPRSSDDLPFFDANATAITYDLWHGYRKLERDGAKPAYPFGFGLSYSTFRYELIEAPAQLPREGARAVKVRVTDKASANPIVNAFVQADYFQKGGLRWGLIQ